MDCFTLSYVSLAIGALLVAFVLILARVGWCIASELARCIGPRESLPLEDWQSDVRAIREATK